MNIWIDDIRTPPDDTWLWAKTYAQAVYFINQSCALEGEDIYAISFDHDLGEEKTGYDAALYLAELVWYGYTLKPHIAAVHSANPPGRDNIQSVIDRYLR